MVSAGTQTGQQPPGGGVWLITDTLEPEPEPVVGATCGVNSSSSGHGETGSSSFLLFRPR